MAGHSHAPEEDSFLEDLKFDSALDGFYSGESTNINLSPQPTAIGGGGYSQAGVPAGNMDAAAKPKQAEGDSSHAATAAMAMAAATALFGGKFGDASALAGGGIDKIAAAALPAALQPMKEQAGKFWSKAQPWRHFFWPLSIPPASEGCSRITANIYNFQTNYAILFVVQLMMNVLLQPSALVTIVMTIVVWYFFLKKNDDPEWKPEVGGVQLGPMQRWLALAATTSILLLLVAGSTIFNATLVFFFFAGAHGVVHDPTRMGTPGTATPPMDV